MLGNHDIQIIAKQWIERHGDEALEQLELRVYELKQHNLAKAHALWVEILKEVKHQLEKKLD